MDDVPPATFGRVDGAQDQVVLVQQGRAGQVAGRARWIEGQVSQEPTARRVCAGDVLKLLDVLQTGLRAAVALLEDRLAELADATDLGRGPPALVARLPTIRERVP